MLVNFKSFYDTIFIFENIMNLQLLHKRLSGTFGSWFQVLGFRFQVLGSDFNVPGLIRINILGKKESHSTFMRFTQLIFKHDLTFTGSSYFVILDILLGEERSYFRIFSINPIISFVTKIIDIKISQQTEEGFIFFQFYPSGLQNRFYRKTW